MTLTMTDRADWGAYIRPGDEEMRWQQIPWHSTFYSAVCEAQRREMPILFWAMNGHPLACT